MEIIRGKVYIEKTMGVIVKALENSKSEVFSGIVLDGGVYYYNNDRLKNLVSNNYELVSFKEVEVKTLYINLKYLQGSPNRSLKVYEMKDKMECILDEYVSEVHGEIEDYRQETVKKFVSEKLGLGDSVEFMFL